MFQAVREQEKAKDGDGEDESDVEEEMSEMSEEAPGKVAIADDELDDELSKEQQRKLHGDILDVITQFVKINNYQEHEYYGVTKQTLKQQQKKKAKQQAAQIQKEKDAKADVSHPKEKPEKTKKSQQKRQSQQKEQLQTGSNSGTNYQSNTLSVAQKRRSFNAAETSILPQKQVITNEQLSQQLQHMGGTRLRGGLASPLYYNLYQSTSNFSNFYVYRFDERNKPTNSLHQQVLQQHGASYQQSYLNTEPVSQDPSPQRNQKQQSSQVVSGYHSVQNSETGKVYHLSKNTDGTGNHIMVSSNYASGSHPQQQYGGAFGSRKSHQKEHLPVENSQSMIIGKTSSDQHHSGGNQSHVNEFSTQLEQMRHSQQQQAVQPMIFNFFNSKNEIKKRNHNRDHRQSERNNMLGTFQGASSNNNNHNEPGFHNRQSNKYSNNTNNNEGVVGVRKQASIPAGRGQMIESFFSVNSEVNGQSYSKHPTSNNINQPLDAQNNISTAVNERYPNVVNQSKDQSQSAQNSGAHFYRQKTNSVRTGVNHQKSQQAQNAQVVTTVQSAARNLAKSGVSQKSRSSFQTRKHQFTDLKEKTQQQQLQQQQDNKPYPKLDLSHHKSSPPSLASQQIKTQQQTKSAKFANIVAGAEIMKTQHSQVDTPSGDQNNFQTLPRRQTKNSNAAGPLSHSNKDQILAQFVKSSDVRAEQLNQTQGLQAEQSTFEGSSSELKRNAIRQIHPLKSFNGIPQDAQKSMSSTQGNKFGHQRQDDHQRRVALPSESIPEIGINKLIPVGPSFSRGHQDSLNRQAQAQAQAQAAHAMMVKKKTSHISGNDRQIDGSTIQGLHHTSDLLEDHPSFIPRISLTSNGINPTQQHQPMRHRLSFQDQSIGHLHYQQQLQQNVDYSNYKAAENPNIDMIDMNNLYANQLKSKPHGIKQFTAQQAHSCEPSNRNGVGLRKQSSQFSSAAHEPTLINNGSVVGGVNNNFIPAGQKKNDSQRLTNDHSSLRRSGDYQSKIHKQISSEPGGPQQLILGTKQQSSSDVVAEKNETMSSHMNKMLTVSKPSFGQRVPPELYQKNPYMQQTVSKAQQQRSGAPTGSKSELRFSASQNCANIDPIHQQTRSNNMVMIVTENESLQDSSNRILASPNRVQIASANTSYHQPQYSSESQQRTSQIQRNRLISQAQKLEGYSHTNPLLGKPNLPLTKSKTTVGQHQMVNGSSNLQHTPSQGIQNIFADPNYGIGSVKNLQTGKVSATTAASRHLNSPRELREEQIKLVPETQALRDIKALWLKNNQPLKEQVNDQQQFNNIFEQNQQQNNAASHNQSSNNTLSAQKAIANGSIIRIQKLKYQGLIKQRGAPIIVHSPEQISRGVFNSNANTDRSNNDDGFSSPASQTKTTNQQIQMDMRDQQSKRVSSGPRGRRAGAPDPYDQCSEPMEGGTTLNFTGIKYGASMALDSNGGSGAQERITVQDAMQSNHYATHKKFSLGSKPAQVIQQLNMDSTQRVSYTGLNSGRGTPSKRVNSMTRTGMSLNMASPKVPDNNHKQQQSAVKPDSGASSTKKRQAPSIDSSTRKSRAAEASLKHPQSAKGAHVSGASGKKQTPNNQNNHNSRGRAKVIVKDKTKNS